MSAQTDHNSGKSRLPLVLTIVAGPASFFAAGMLLNIFERKQEAKTPFFNVISLTDDVQDPEVWGKNFPPQYDDYRKTVDMVRTTYGAVKRSHVNQPWMTRDQSRLPANWITSHS
jgi:nitrite reductase (cytochrome c-552)